MRGMFWVRPLLPARFAPDIGSRPARCVHTAIARRLSRPPARSPPRTVCPACDPRQGASTFNQPLSWDTSRVTDMSQMFYVRCSPPPRPPISALSRPLPSTLRAPRSRPVYPLEAARASPLTPRLPSVRLGSPQPPCPPPTSCSSAARGRAPPPSTPLAMAQAVLRDGPRLPAPEALTEVCACGRGRVHGGSLYHSPQHMCVAATPTPT